MLIRYRFKVTDKMVCPWRNYDRKPCGESVFSPIVLGIGYTDDKSVLRFLIRCSKCGRLFFLLRKCVFKQPQYSRVLYHKCSECDNFSMEGLVCSAYNTTLSIESLQIKTRCRLFKRR